MDVQRSFSKHQQASPLYDSAKISISWRRDFPRRCRPLYVPVQTLIQQLTLEGPSVFSILFDMWIGRQPPLPTNVPIIKNLVSDEERPQKVGDVFLGWLGKRKFFQLARGRMCPQAVLRELAGISAHSGVRRIRLPSKEGGAKGEGKKSNRKRLRGAQKTWKWVDRTKMTCWKNA